MGIELTSPSGNHTAHIGKKLGQLLRQQLTSQTLWTETQIGAFVIALHGEMGAGKTTLTQGIAAGFGVQGPVTSPTFTIVNEYETADGLEFLHMDSYRLNDSGSHAELEAVAFGMDELLQREGAVLIIEWAERVKALLPADTLSITLRYLSDSGQLGRELSLCASGPHSQQLVQLMASLS